MTISALAEKIRKNKIYVVITWLIFLIDIAIIVFVVGTNNNSYAGVDTSAGLKSVIYSTYHVLNGKLKVYLLLSALGIIVIASGLYIKINRKEVSVTRKEIINKLVIYGFLYGYILITQIFLYLKSGMVERYLLPTVAAFAMIWMIDLYAEVEHWQISFVYNPFLVMTVIVLISISRDQTEAVKYAKDGADVTAAFSKVAEFADKDTKVIVGIGYEADLSTSVYLQENYGIDTVYNVFFNEIENGMAKDCYSVNLQAIQSIAIADADIYIDYQGTLEEIFNKYSINNSLYTEYVYGDYRIMVNEQK